MSWCRFEYLNFNKYYMKKQKNKQNLKESLTRIKREVEDPVQDKMNELNKNVI